MRILYVAKISETEIKGDVENSMNNRFRELIKEPITGLKLIIGAWTIHLVEGNTHTLKNLMKAINNTMTGQHPFYNHAWVLHFVDEAPTRVFNQWVCKSVVIGGAGKELKSLNPLDKAYTIYEAMLEIGKQLVGKDLSHNKDPTFLKNLVQDSLPVGDELASACTDQEMSLNEFVQFLLDPPDILLEKELVWPVEPDLMY